jgi:hypothetical protein
MFAGSWVGGMSVKTLSRFFLAVIISWKDEVVGGIKPLAGLSSSIS